MRVPPTRPQDQEHSDEQDAHQPAARPHDRKREPTTALVWLTQIMCVGVLKHVRKDTNGQSGRDHLTGGAAPTLDR